ITMIPEGLVLLTSVAFAVGVIRLGRRRCLVQELPAIEVLARVDVLCLDKTGTLTEPGMELDQVIEVAPDVPVRKVLASLIGAEERPNPTLQAIASGLAGLPAAGDAAGRVLADGTPTDGVPAGGVPAGGVSAQAPALAGVPGGEARWRPVHAVPFSSARKWSGAVFTDAGPASGGWGPRAPPVPLPPAARPRPRGGGGGGGGGPGGAGGGRGGGGGRRGGRPPGRGPAPGGGGRAAGVAAAVARGGEPYPGVFR